MTHPLRWMALVALDRPALPSFDVVAVWYGEQFPDAPPLVPAGSTDGLLTMTIGEYTAAAALVPRPIPWSQLEGPAATAWYWPEATESLRDHVAHLLVTLVDEGGRPIAKSLALTRLTAALTDTSPSGGVFWGPGRLVHPPLAFVEQATQASETNLPLYLWVDFRIEQLDDGALRLYTTGLDALGGAELEAAHYDGSPQRLLEFAYNIAHYQLDSRKAIRDGDTIGLTEEVQVTAHRGPSLLGGEMEVLQLDFAGEDTRGSLR
jgi:hypothetical protein